MFKRNFLSVFPSLMLAIGYKFSVDGGDGGGQANPPAVDVDAKVAEAVNAAQAKFQAQFREATGHDSLDAFKQHQLKEQGKLQELADANKQQAETYKGQLHQTLITNALLSASGDAIDSDVVVELLAGKGSVDANGNVTINGKSAKDAVADFLKAKPHLAKPSGSTGSGAGHTTSTPNVDVSKMTPAQKMAHGRAQRQG